MNPLSPSVFDYIDYRDFLKEYLAAHRLDPRYTHRSILCTMKISSTGFLANILSGKRNLSDAQASSLAVALSLPRAERLRFESMVSYNQAGSLEEKKWAFDRMMKVGKGGAKTLNPLQYRLFSKWQTVYIRELLAVMPFCKDDYKKIAALFRWNVTTEEIEKSLTILIDTGLVKLDSQGIFRLTEKSVTAGDEVSSIDLAFFQKTTIGFAQEALEQIPPEERDISFCTCSLSKEGFLRMKKEIADFRKRILEIARQDRDSHEVYQCNIQCFPVTQRGQAQ